MKKYLGLVLAILIVLSGCSAKNEEPAQSTEQTAQPTATVAPVEAVSKEIIKEMCGDYDCFAIGETANLMNVELTVTNASYVEATKKFNGKQADYAVEIGFTLKNNGTTVYRPLGDLTLVPYEETAETFTSYMSDQERKTYDAGVNPGEIKTFRIRSQYNADEPLPALARWAPGSSIIAQTQFVVFFDINELLAQSTPAKK